MKHYHLTKKIVKFLIVADIIFFSAAFINIYHIKNQTIKTRAESTDNLDHDCNSYGIKFATPPASTVSINSPLNVGFMIDPTNDPEYDLSYDYAFIVYDRQKDKEIMTLTEPDVLLSSTHLRGTLDKNTYLKNENIYFPYTGDFSIKIEYQVGECEKRYTPSYNVTVKKKGNGSATLNVQSRVSQGDGLKITYTIKDNVNNSFTIFINKGGTECPASKETTECWPEVKKQNVLSNDQTNSFFWPTSGAQLGGHEIRLKVFSKDGLEADATATFSICKPEYMADSTKCVGDGSDNSGGNSNTAPSGTIQVDESKFNLTLGSLFGGKDMTQIGLDDLFSPDNGKSILSNARKIALDLAGVVAIIMILWSSITYATSYGEESKAEIAKKTLTWSVIGLIVIIFSQTIFTLIEYYL